MLRRIDGGAEGPDGALGSPNIDCRQDGAKLEPVARAGYMFNPGVAGIDDADAILLVGTNPRWECAGAQCPHPQALPDRAAAPLRASAPAVDVTYPVERLGAGPATSAEVVEGRHSFAEKLKAAKNPMIVVGMGALARADGSAVLALLRQLAESVNAQNGLAILHTAAARVGGLDLGLVPGEGGRDVAGIFDGCEKREIDVVYLLGADEIDTKKLGRAFVVYQGCMGDAGAHRADVILPGAAYTEKPGTYVNTEGRVQQAHAPSIRRAMLATIGRSSVRCRTRWAGPCPTTRSSRCARVSSP